ncbi:MAG: hypothetical protein ACFE9N_08185 [Promethearchaeota archaeon]
MSFGKAFGFSLLAFIGLNAAFFLIGEGVNGTLGIYFTYVASYPQGIIYMLVGPLMTRTGPQFPYIMYSTFSLWVSGAPVEAGDVIMFIGYIVAPAVAAFLSGRFGENKLEAFMGWFATVMIWALIIMIVLIIEAVTLGVPPLVTFLSAMLPIAIGLVYGLSFGSIALLTTREF